MRLRTFGLMLGLSVSAFLAGCGGGSSHTTPPATLSVTTTTLPAGAIGAAYTASLAATGGTAPYSWTLASGTLPAGLTLSSTGAIAGTPTAAGSGPITVKVTDSESTPMSAVSGSLTIAISAPPVSITTTSLPEGTVNVAYSTSLTVTGGVAPYTWSISSGNLPAGLALNPSTGAISGTPTAVGITSFTVMVADSQSTPSTATAKLSVAISGGTLAITTTPPLAAGTVATPYNAQLAATGGIPPYTWSLASGSPSLPALFTLSPAGVISGTSPVVASSTPDFEVTDAFGAVATTQALVVTINPVPVTVPDGVYAFTFDGVTSQGTFAIDGAFTLSKGTVTKGLFDQNEAPSVPQTEQAITGGSLTTGASGLGQLQLTLAGGASLTFAFSSPASITTTGSDSDIRVIKFDDTTGTGTRASGILKLASATPITVASLKGSYAIHLSGVDPAGAPAALVGYMTADGNGNITGGNADKNDNGTVSQFTNILGTYTIDAQGRGLIQVHLNGPIYSFSFYPVSATELLTISVDQSSPSAILDAPLVSGSMLQQTGAPFSAASFKGASVLEMVGQASSAGVLAPDITLGLATPDGNGNIGVSYDEFSGTLQAPVTYTGTYALDPVTGPSGGRTVVTSSGTKLVLYLISSSEAFVLGTTPSAGSGLLEIQSGSPFTDSTFFGNYYGGTVPLPNASANNEVDLVGADGLGDLTMNFDSSGPKGLLANQVLTGTYSVDQTGRAVVTAADGISRIFYVVSPTKVVLLSGSGEGYLGSFEQ